MKFRLFNTQSRVQCEKGKIQNPPCVDRRSIRRRKRSPSITSVFDHLHFHFNKTQTPVAAPVSIRVPATDSRSLFC